VNAEAAALLIATRRGRQRIERLPEACRPVDVAAGYALQSKVVAGLGEVGGYKIGAGGPEETPLYAPILTHEIHPSGVSLSLAAFPGALIEAEIAFRLRCDLPHRDAAYDLAEVAAAVETLPALEIFGSRYLDPGAVSEGENLADCLANAGLIVGQPFTPPRSGHDASRDIASRDIASWNIDLVIDGKTGSVRAARHPVGDPLRLVVWLANHLRGSGDGLRAGQVVTTGALVLAPVGREVRGDWEGLGSVSVRFA
jgi:2-keto-4-pentenoate hydratase